MMRKAERLSVVSFVDRTRARRFLPLRGLASNDQEDPLCWPEFQIKNAV